MDAHMKTPSVEAMELLSESWCSSAIQVFQPAIKESSIIPLIGTSCETCPILKSDRNRKMEDFGESESLPPWKLDDLKSWIWVQQAMHPELDYDLCFRKKWFSRKFKSWTGVSIRKWMKEMKRKRKEEDRLRRAEVHAAISVAGVAAALAAIAAENNTATGDRPQPKSLKETAIASAAALVAAQCAQVAEAAGAKKDQIASAIDAATTATDASNIITLTAAAATSLKGAATLRGRPGHRESLPAVGNDCDYGRCRALLAKGDELLVETSDGKCRLRAVSIVLNIDGQVVLKIKKHNFFMVLSNAEESIVYKLQAKLHKEPLDKNDESYSIKMTTSRGEIEVIIDDYMQYRKWTMTIDHMLSLSTTFGKFGNSTVQ